MPDTVLPDTALPDAAPLNLRQLADAGGVIGFLILGLSILLVAVVVQHLLATRKQGLMPRGLADEVHAAIAQGRYADALAACKTQPSVLAGLLSAALAEVRLGYAAVEKALEDAAAQQAARLGRQVEYLQTISTIAPMLGLLGTVWGMIQAFVEFEQKANPQVAELAPGIYKALVTTLLGLGVAVPAVAAYAILRSRVDERMAETALLAEQVFADYKQATGRRTKPAAAPRPAAPPPAAISPAATPIPPVARERRG